MIRKQRGGAVKRIKNVWTLSKVFRPILVVFCLLDGVKVVVVVIVIVIVVVFLIGSTFLAIDSNH